MKVLWFTNIAVTSNKKKVGAPKGGSWMRALELKLTKFDNFQLGIAYQSNVTEIQISESESSICFEIPKNSGLKRRWGIRYNYYIDNERALKDYLNVVEKFKPDLIQIFGSENNFGIIIPHIKIPVVIHTQGVITVYKEKYFSGITNEEIVKHSSYKNKITNGGLLLGYKIFEKRSEVEKECLMNCKYVLGRTSWDRSILKILAPKAEYFHCDEMIRDEFFENKWEPTNNSIPKIVSLIRNDPYKGMETIIKTSKLLLKLNIKFEWFIIGCQEHDLTNSILTKIYKTNFSELGIKFFGNLYASEIIDVFKESDVFVQPSHIENSPNSVCEAMLMGLPVIATFAGGTSSILENGKEGILFQDGDPYSLAGSIIELFSNVNMQINYSVNARKKALERHNPEKIVSDLLSIYNKIISIEKEKIKELY